MKKFIKKHGITILIDAAVIFLAEMIMSFLGIENIWMQIGGITVALIIAEAVLKFVSDKKSEKE